MRAAAQQTADSLLLQFQRQGKAGVSRRATKKGDEIQRVGKCRVEN